VNLDHVVHLDEVFKDQLVKRENPDPQVSLVYLEEVENLD